MMVRYCTLFTLILLLQGCAYLHSLNSELPQQIDEWVAANEYGKALDTLSYVSKTHKQYALLQKKKHSILLKAKEYEHNQHLSAQNMEHNGEWYKAELIYISALDKYPQSKLLASEHQAFIQRRDKYLENLEFKLSIARGVWLIESTPIQKEILSITPEDYSTQRRYKKNTEQLQQTANELMNCTEIAIQAGRISLAETCMQTADRLNPPYVDKKKLKSLQAQLAEKHQQVIKEQNTKTRALLSELKQGYSHDNLKRAHQHLSELKEQKNHNKQSIELMRELEKYIQTGLTQRMEAGRRLYSDGQIEQALSIWIPLKSVAPGNTKLNDYIERAKRVLNKLETLSNNPQTITPPQ